LNIKNDRGYIYIETLITIVIIGIIFAASATIGRNFLLNTMAEYEATKLISTIRYVQELNRNSYIVREGEFEQIEPANSTTFRISIEDYFYQIKSSSDKFEPRKCTTIKNVTLSKNQPFNDGIRFYTDGTPKTFGTIQVKSKIGTKTASRYVIIDKAGRIRMDRNPP